MTWVELAACRGKDTALWFPGNYETQKAAQAKAVCHRCPVRSECLEEHLTEKEGIWGGKSVMERRRERQRRGATVRPHGPDCQCPAHGGRRAS